MQNKNLYVTLHIAILLAINRTTCTMTIKERLSGLHLLSQSFLKTAGTAQMLNCFSEL